MRPACLCVLPLALGCSQAGPGGVDLSPPDARVAPAGDLAGDLAADLAVPGDLRPYGGWSRRLGAGEFSEVNGIAIDGQGNVIAAAEVGGRVLMGPDGTRASLIKYSPQGDVNLGTGTLSGAGKNDAFVLALSPAGKPLAARRFGSPGLEAAYGVATNGRNQVAGGFFQGTVDFGAGPLQVMGDGNTVDAFVVQLDLMSGE